MRVLEFVFSSTLIAVLSGCVSAQPTTMPTSAPASQPATARSPAAELKSLLSAGRNEEALALADKLLGGPSESGSWSLPFKNMAAREAFVGQSFGYFVVNRSEPVPPALPVKPEHKLRPLAGVDQLSNHVTAINLTTGQAVWTRAISIQTRVAIDPRDDSLWMWNERARWYMQVDPKTGDLRREGTLPETTGASYILECLVDDDTELWSRTLNGSLTSFAATRLDLAQGEIRRDWPRPDLRSPGGLRVLGFARAPSGSEITCSPPFGKPVWTFNARSHVEDPPTWIGRDVLVVAGSAERILYQLDGETGNPKWEAALAPAPKRPDIPLRPNERFTAGGWVPYGLFNDEVWAFGGDNTLRFFNPQTGERTRTIPLPDEPIAPPKLEAGGAVTVATWRGFERIVPRDKSEKLSNGELRALRLRALIALGRNDEARADLSTVLKQAESADDWETIGNALEPSGKPIDAAAARVRAMTAGDRTDSETLRRTHGLIARFPTRSISAPPAVSGTQVFFAELFGDLLSIDAAAPTTVEHKPLKPGDHSRLITRGRQLILFDSDRAEIVIHEFSTEPTLAIDDPLKPAMSAPKEKSGFEREWYNATRTENLNEPRLIDGRLVRAARRGGVRELVNGAISEWPGNYDNMATWRFVHIDGKPFAAGDGGVYNLDEKLRPAERLITLAGEGAARVPSVWRLASSENSIAIVAVTRPSASLQVWSRDGQHLLRSEPVVEEPFAVYEKGRLIRLGEGYLLSSADLVYMPDDPKKPIWRFSTRFEGDGRDPLSDVSRNSFGVPRVINDRLVAAGQNGGIYLFDLKAAGILP